MEGGVGGPREYHFPFCQRAFAAIPDFFSNPKYANFRACGAHFKTVGNTENPIFHKSKSSGHHPPICDTTFAANPLQSYIIVISQAI